MPVVGQNLDDVQSRTPDSGLPAALEALDVPPWPSVSKGEISWN